MFSMRTRWCATWVFAFFGALLALTVLAREASAQAPGPAAAASVNRVDEEAPDSPRASIQNFLELCQRRRFAEAAQYLDVPRGDKRGPELAQKLDVVLEERLWIHSDLLSPRSEGRTDDGLSAGIDEIGKIDDAKGRSIPIRIVRHESRSAEDEDRWIFAQSTVHNIDALYASLRGHFVREHFPAWLQETGPFSLYLWQWLAIPIIAAIAIAVGRFLAWVSGRVARKITTEASWTRRLLLRLQRPVTMGWALALFWFASPYLVLTVRADDLVERVLRALGWLTFFWALLRGVTVVGDELSRTAWAHAKPSVRSLSSVGVKLGRIVVAIFALMVAFSELGYPVTSIVAGLGIGGIALALAAQKTVENLFGSISILADQPFRVGDTIRVDAVEATVENIGLRSTRMRTADRSLVILPNGKLADMRIESMSERERLRFATRLSLDLSTPADRIRAIVKAIRRHLEGHEKVRKQDILVRLSALAPTSLDIEVVAMIESLEFAEFAKIREELLLMYIEIVSKEGASLAIPTQRLVSPSS